MLGLVTIALAINDILDNVICKVCNMTNKKPFLVALQGDSNENVHEGKTKVQKDIP
jgi:hypothetical protein